MKQNLRRVAVRAGTAKSNMTWYGIMVPSDGDDAQDRVKARAIARASFETRRGQALAHNEQLIVEVRT